VERDPDHGRNVYLVVRDLLTGVILLVFAVRIAELRLPGGGTVTGVGGWLSAASGYFAYRAALYLRLGEAYPQETVAGSALRRRWRSLLKAQPKAPQGRTAS
jgi:hypothetical protein